MFDTLIKTAFTKFNPFAVAIPTGIKAIKYFMDSTLREKVTPVAGSVLYCDLWVAVEHSGIYVGDGNISNIEVEGMAESAVRRCSPASFTSKSTLGQKIYVSCNKQSAVGDDNVADYANDQVGERSFYGLVLKNCHQFSQKCVEQSSQLKNTSWLEVASDILTPDTWELTIGALKQAARKNLGATKWRLWDWQNDNKNESPPPEPDWQAQQDYFKNLPLNAESIQQIQQQLAATQAYEQEIADENIPEPIRKHLAGFRLAMQDIANTYENAKGFLIACGANFSYADLKACSEDFSALANALQNNHKIKELAQKMGRAYISEEKKKQTKIPQASKSEVHGTHRSDDVMRILPSELLNLEDEDLEILFYARLLEKQLLTYELQGTTFVIGETTETEKQRTGPVVACLDTSGSMQGQPMLKAKVLLLAIANILQKENRSLHVLLFGASGEIREFSMLGKNEAAGLLKFLQQGFGGGTDFETPLQRALDIIASQKDYQKADVLMISDGDCQLSPTFMKHFSVQKQVLDCMAYSVLCADTRIKDEFSDEVVVL
ncbi:MAG: VWA domain-containing protein [Agitococcus sp.]|nr:VWA domain-containing protein [Agitococcus sp.]